MRDPSTATTGRREQVRFKSRCRAARIGDDRIGQGREMIFCRYRKSDFVSYGIVEDDVVRAIEGDPFSGYTLATARYPFFRMFSSICIPLRSIAMR